MATVSRAQVAPVALAVLLVLAGCSGTAGPTEGAATSSASTASERPTATPGPATTGAPTRVEPATTRAPTRRAEPTTGVSVPTGELEGPPYDVDEYPLAVWIYGVHYERLRNATFTYERERRSAGPMADRQDGQDETIRVGENGRVHWTTTLYGVGRNGSVTIDTYRDGDGLQCERGPDRQTEEIEHRVFNHSDDLFAETLALGPRDARFALSLVDPGASNLSYGGIRTVGGERLHVYETANASENHSVDVSLLVTDRGVIRQATTRWTIDSEDGSRSVESTEIYRDVNETTVEPPDWLDEAWGANR